MAMSYTSLIGSKSTTGSIKAWVNYSLLDSVTVVDEAQSLLWSLLRTREMLTDFAFTMQVGQSYIDLPARFLDPIGRLYLSSFNTYVRHKDGNFIQSNRTYSETSGTLGADPFATTDGSDTVTVTLASHGFTQDSVFSTTGAATFNGTTIEGTFPVTGIVDANTFTIDISSIDDTPTGTGSGGGSAVDYVCDVLVSGVPVWYGIWNERIYFDTAFFQAALCKLQYYRSPALLSADNESNWLTDRYPRLMRQACITAAADFMKDTNEYNKNLTALTGMVQAVAVENDMQYRGMELDTYTP